MTRIASILRKTTPLSSARWASEMFAISSSCAAPVPDLVRQRPVEGAQPVLTLAHAELHELHVVRHRRLLCHDKSLKHAMRASEQLVGRARYPKRC